MLDNIEEKFKIYADENIELLKSTDNIEKVMCDVNEVQDHMTNSNFVSDKLTTQKYPRGR